MGQANPACPHGRYCDIIINSCFIVSQCIYEVNPLLEILSDSFFDIVKTLPLLLLVYALLYYVENRLTNTPTLLARAARFGPVVGALAGTVPQCGFSAAAAALFSAGYLAPATLVAVFLATSDEAVPVLLAGGVGFQKVILLLVTKFALAVVGGYLLRLTVFREKKRGHEPIEIEMEDCSCCSGGSPVAVVLWRTLKTGLFLFLILLALNGVIALIGEDRLSALLLADTVWQPLLCAVLGLVPSCAMSVLLSQLYVSGTLSFGALIAGLSTGAGFGYIVLFQEKEGRRRALPVIAATFVLAVIGGTLLQLFS